MMPGKLSSIQKAVLLLLLLPVSIHPALAQINQAAAKNQGWYNLDEQNFKSWGRIKMVSGAAVWPVSGKLVYTHPDGARGWYTEGLIGENDGTFDARKWYGLRFEVYLNTNRPFNIDLTAALPAQSGFRSLMYATSAKAQVQGKGWHMITIPFSTFDYRRGETHAMKFIKQLTFEGSVEGATASTTPALLKNVRLILGNSLHLQSDIQSLPAGADSTVTYTVNVTNTLASTQTVSLTLTHNGWEGMPADVSPKVMQLQAGQSKIATVTVKVPAFVPQGAQEPQTLTVSGAGTASPPETMQFITTRRINGAYLVRTEAGWQEVLQNTQKYEWAKKCLKELIAQADAWQVPVVPKGGIMSDQGTRGLFKAYIERDIWATAVAWKLTGNKSYAEKTVLFLRRFADPLNGYPTTLHATIQGQPQEGGFMEGVVRSYNLIRDAGFLTDEDKKNVEHCLRLFVGVAKEMMDGGISNWNIFNTAPAAQCALALQDISDFNYLLYGPCGIVDQLRYGTLNDGWWYEMSLSYNLGCAENLTAMALAARPFGIDLLHTQFPISLSPNTGLRPFEAEKVLGMAFTKFGPLNSNFISIKKLWDGITQYPDYRGVMFGMGDGHEEFVLGRGFEMAYYAYRDSAYAAIIKEGDKRNLIYAVADLPVNTPKLYTQSAYAPNAGIAVLRSQTEGRSPGEQIQAAAKFGTHGSYHGHFDRVSLVSLMRYGRSFYSPETSWFGYGSYMYKWWVQVSLAHNMVIVDGKMQEPVDSRPLLFHSGKMMQIMAAETEARWSNPPYMGGYDQVKLVKAGLSPYVPIPDSIPGFKMVTGYTEPVLQRRLLLVTDDYVLQADYLKGQTEHTFDNMIHLRGAALTEKLPFISHDAQFDTSRLSSGQFITNVDKYQLNGTTRVGSIIRFAEKGPDGQNMKHGNWESGGHNQGFNEPGVLHVDSWNLYPQKAQLLMADYPEAWPVNKKLVYTVTGDGKKLATDSLGTWILGKGTVDADVKGMKELKLITHTNRAANTLNTLFWANAKLIMADGREISLSQLKTGAVNIIPTTQKGKDYAGGIIKIAGNVYTDVLPAEPQSIAEDGMITVDLTGLNAVRFKAFVGGDWPVGDEEQLRKMVDYRVAGKEARFVTILEPYESTQMVKGAQAVDANKIKVELNDGRIQEITITGLDGDGKHITADISELKDGKIVRTEKAVNQP